MELMLPEVDGTLQPYRMHNARCVYPARPDFRFNRTVYAAAHVVVDPLQDTRPWEDTVPVDWERTLAFRDFLWDMGFGVAEAMDTAQRGMGLSWEQSAELIRRSAARANERDRAPICCGAGTDQLALFESPTLDDVIDAYREQFDVIESAGAIPVMMASRALRHIAESKDDYRTVYETLLDEADDKVILHWLGEAFDPSLQGYWGSDDIAEAMDVVMDIIHRHPAKIEGIKISLLDPQWELMLRDRLPTGVKLFTGDDFNYSELIEGDAKGCSHALLGILDPIAPVAGAAFTALANGDIAAYRRILSPTVALSREIFRKPTQYYKAGIVFLAWLNGHQDHFSMLGGMQSARPLTYYAKVFRLADQAGALLDPALARARMQSLMAVYGGV